MICTEPTTRKVGQQSVFTATFYNDAGALVDPTTVTFKFKKKNANTEQSFTFPDTSITHVSTGVFKFEAPIYDTAERYVIAAVSVDPVTYTEAEIKVEASAFAPT